MNFLIAEYTYPPKFYVYFDFLILYHVYRTCEENDVSIFERNALRGN